MAERLEKNETMEKPTSEVAEQIHQERVNSHEKIVEKLRTRHAGDTFQDFWGATYEVIRIDSSYPRPGYVAKHLSGPYPTTNNMFVGFDSVKDLRINPTTDWEKARKLASKHPTQFAGELVYEYGPIDLTDEAELEFVEILKAESKLYGCRVVTFEGFVYFVFPGA